MEYPERVTLCEDGVYRWKYQLSREQALAHWREMVVICTIVSTVIAVIMLAMIGLSALWLILLGIYGLCDALPALIGYLILGWDSRSYEMDEQAIRHKHATKGGDAFIIFEKIKDMRVSAGVFTIKEGITTYTVYVPYEDAEFVRRYIRERMRPAGQ
ncbi:MAG: hypothetical protein IJ048_11460 [Clostridia bacterium]|nr:hypothetical protein [Clostridia bacterium]